MPERRHLERLASDYNALRGLFYLPISGLLVVSALSNENWGPFASDVPFFVALAIAGVLALGIDQYYRRTFGKVRLSHADQMRAIWLALASAPAYLIVALLLRSYVPWSLDLPVNPVAICFAGLLAVGYLATTTLRRAHAIVLGALFIVGALPVWTGGDPSNAGLVVVAVAMVTLGLLDHRYLVHHLGPGRAATAQVGAAR